MKKDISIDVVIRDVDKTATIDFSHANFSFSMNLGSLLKIFIEDDQILFLQFEKGDIRIEISLDELYMKAVKQES